MPAKFKFGGHLTPFWTDDRQGRVEVRVYSCAGGSHPRCDIYHVEDSTVGQVASAVEQALFQTEEGRPTPVARPLGIGVYNNLCQSLTPDDLPALRRVVNYLERQEAQQVCNCQGCQARRVKEAACDKAAACEPPEGAQ